jgi:hypothetical protein
MIEKIIGPKKKKDVQLSMYVNGQHASVECLKNKSQNCFLNVS